MKKKEKPVVPVGTMVMLSGVNTTTGPVKIVRYLPKNRAWVEHNGVMFNISMSRVIVPGARIRQ